jgi:hypothetical protein
VKTRTAYRVMMFANAAYLRQTYGEAFYRTFRAAADDKLQELIPRIPDLGDSVASMSYACRLKLSSRETGASRLAPVTHGER